MKNYYEILQVNENASKEIIEKAYKVLVKKYHPDLQKDIKAKEFAEKKLEEINEAYDVLSNEFLKGQYDIELKKEIEEQLEKKYTKQNYGTEKENFYIPYQNQERQTKKENILAIVLTIIVVIILGIILWFIPFTNGWMREITIENPIFLWVKNIFGK